MVLLQVSEMENDEGHDCNGSPAPSIFPVNSLPAGVLANVFKHIPFAERHNVVPLVCKVWQGVCRDPSVWEVVELNGRSEFRVLELVQESGIQVTRLRRTPPVLEWLAKYASGIKTLKFHFSFPGWSPAWLAALFFLLPAHLTTLDLHLSTHEPLRGLWSALQRFTSPKHLSLQVDMPFTQLNDLQPLSRLTSLQSLTVSVNEVPSRFPDFISALTNLRALHYKSRGQCREQYIARKTKFLFPMWLPHLRQLNVLTLESIPVYRLPPVVAKLSRLQQLSITQTGVLFDLNGMDDRLSQLSCINSLRLDTAVRILPSVIAALTSLTRLDLSRCKASPNVSLTFPATVTRLTLLSVLNLREVRDVDEGTLESISQLSSLTELDLTCCGIRDFSDTFAGLSKLQRLYLGGNLLKDIPSAVYQLTKLKSLDLSNNFLLEVNKGVVGLLDLPELMYLALCMGRGAKRWSYDAFEALVELYGQVQRKDAEEFEFDFLHLHEDFEVINHQTGSVHYYDVTKDKLEDIPSFLKEVLTSVEQASIKKMKMGSFSPSEVTADYGSYSNPSMGVSLWLSGLPG